MIVERRLLGRLTPSEERLYRRTARVVRLIDELTRPGSQVSTVELREDVAAVRRLAKRSRRPEVWEMARQAVIVEIMLGWRV